MADSLAMPSRRPPSLFYGSFSLPEDLGRRVGAGAHGASASALAGSDAPGIDARSERAAVVWTPSGSLRRMVCDALIAAQITPLVPATFRHIASSVSPGARPLAELALLDFDAMTATDLAVLASIRWAGFSGPIIAITQSGTLDPITRQRYQVEAVLRRRRVSTALTGLLHKLSQPL